MTRPFVHLHVHSDFSQLDGCSTVREYVEESESRGYPAIALTEHGSVRSFFELYSQCSGKKVRPIFGAEFYLSMDAKQKGLSDEEKKVVSRGLDPKLARSRVQKRERELGIQGRFHLSVWAKDNVGLQNLFRLSSTAWTDGFYYRPRVDPMSLVDHGEGLIVGSACISSPFFQMFKDGNEKQSFEMAQYLCDTLGSENLVFELMPHPLADQVEANHFHIRMAQHFGCRIIATQDAHYLRPEDRVHHEVLLAIGTGKTLNDLDRFTFEGEGTYHFKTWEEMVEGFRTFHGLDDEWCEAIYRDTMEVASQCNASLSLDRFKGLIPEPHLPEPYKTPTAYLQFLCVEGWKRRELSERLTDEQRRAYKTRLRYELETLRDKNFVSYFLMVQEMYSWARSQGIMAGPGRGSSAGSLVAYLLGITQVDPIEHGLYFERFINPSRIDFPDIDCDFEDRRRGEILEYLSDRYGQERVCRIATFGTLAAKQAVKDVARVLDVPFSDSNRCTAAILDGVSLRENFEGNPICSEFAEHYPQVLAHAERLEGFVKHVGIHAAGVVVSPVPLIDVVPIETREHKGVRTKVTGVDMKAVQELGLVKLDVLGLKTLTTLRLCLEAIRENRGEEVILENIPLDDPDSLEGFSEHDFDCIFQFDSHSARKICGRLRFDCFGDIAAVNAVNRPGLTRSGLAQDYIRRKNDPSLCEKDLFCPEVTSLTSETFGVIVYQEQVIAILVELAGFTAAHADIIRKKIGKSEGRDELEKFRTEFVIGVSIKNPHIDPEVSHRLFNALVEFGGYGFNKCIPGDAVVIRGGCRAGESPEITISELFDAQRSRTPWGKKIRSGRLTLLQMDSDGRVRPGKLKKIHYNGVREVVRIYLSNGVEVQATVNHRFLTSSGYKRVDEIRVGDELMAMGEKERYQKRGFASGGRKTYTGCGFPEGEQNPSFVDGRAKRFEEVKARVSKRAGGGCECCGKKRKNGSSFEYSHTLTLDQVGGDFARYHHPGNVRLLCNSCHKMFDYRIGVRKRRWTKGRPVLPVRVLSLTPAGSREVYDIEMDTLEHNFVVNGVVSHNSHAISYSMLSFWGMWLKRRYPLEYFWAQLSTEDDLVEQRRVIRSARRRGVSTLPADVNVSRVGFSIDPEKGVIRGSLVDIKQVGDGAAQEIMEKQPYTSIIDFLKRTDRRAVNKRSFSTLLQSGAFDTLIPNVKEFIENLEKRWKVIRDGRWEKLEKMLEEDSGKEDLPPATRILLATQVNPLAYGAHPLDPYLEFISKRLDEPLEDVEDPELFHRTHYGYVVGWVMEIKAGYHGGMSVIGGKKAASVFCENEQGAAFRVYVPWHVYQEHREKLEGVTGVPLLFYVKCDEERQAMDVRFLVDLSHMKRTFGEVKGKKFDIWERIVFGRHPVSDYEWKTKEHRERVGRDLGEFVLEQPDGNRFILTGVVTSVAEIKDKKGNDMAFIGLKGKVGFCEVTCFSRAWSKFKKLVPPGGFVSVKVLKERRSALLDDLSGRVWAHG
jgi:DNA-directed DNA polymerase III PolC